MKETCPKCGRNRVHLTAMYECRSYYDDATMLLGNGMVVTGPTIDLVQSESCKRIAAIRRHALEAQRTYD